MRPSKYLLLFALLAAGGAAAWYALYPSPESETPVSAGDPGAPMVVVAMPSSLSATALMGQVLFEETCVACHGANAAGSQNGPPLVHKIYEPGHHADVSFLMAVQRGARAHHWTFGDMPPQPDVTATDISAIVAYVRELQRANGIN